MSKGFEREMSWNCTYFNKTGLHIFSR